MIMVVMVTRVCVVVEVEEGGRGLRNSPLLHQPILAALVSGRGTPAAQAWPPPAGPIAAGSRYIG